VYSSNEKPSQQKNDNKNIDIPRKCILQTISNCLLFKLYLKPSKSYYIEAFQWLSDVETFKHSNNFKHELFNSLQLHQIAIEALPQFPHFLPRDRQQFNAQSENRDNYFNDDDILAINSFSFRNQSLRLSTCFATFEASSEQ
jgi:hypothetical protein